MLFLHERTWNPNSSFAFLYKNKLFLDAATAFFPKYNNNPSITPQSGIFRFTAHKVTYHLIKQILLKFEHYVYKTRENWSLDPKVLKRNIHKLKNNEKQTRETKKFWTKMETIVRKHIAHIMSYMVAQQ